MPYAPGIAYQGSNYLYDSIGSLGTDVADAIKKRDELQKTNAYNDMVMQHAYEKGDVSEEDLNKYLSASHSAKTGIAAAHAANIVEDWKRQSQQQDVALKQAQTGLAQAQLNQTGPFAKDPMEGQTYYHPDTGEAVGTYGPSGQVQFFPKQAGDQQYDPVVTDPLKIDGKEIPGIGTNRKTGQYVYYGHSGMERDPKTGALGTRDTKGNFKPVTAEQISAMAMDPNNPTQVAPPQQASPGFWQRVFGGGGAGAAAPAPASGGAVKVSTKADYDALPSGSLYIAPDGSTRKKP